MATEKSGEIQCGRVRIPTRLAALLTSAAILCAAYPEVIFGGASFRPSDIFNKFGQVAPPPSSWFPEPAYRTPLHGQGDLGAPLLQNEPAIHFMRQVLRERQSPFWNPYAACGAFGPESLVDAKTSAFTVLTALAGGGPLAYHAVRLALFGCALYCLLRLLTVCLGVGLPAAAAGGVAFLLNGVAVSNVAGQMYHAYYLAPILLYALCLLADRPGGARLAIAALAEGLLLLETFLPILLLSMLAVHGMAAAYLVQRHGIRRTVGRPTALFAAAPCMGLPLTAPLWLPVIESLRSVNLWQEYNARTLVPFSVNAALSWFTPKHFWESYMGFNQTKPEGVGPVHPRLVLRSHRHSRGGAGGACVFQARESGAADGVDRGPAAAHRLGPGLCALAVHVAGTCPGIYHHQLGLLGRAVDAAARVARRPRL